MITIEHKFLNHKINSQTKILIVGTFNPNSKNNSADFFYGRSRNYLWRILSVAYNNENLKEASREKKIEFINKHKIDFADMIKEIEVEKGQEGNFYDNYIDKKVTEWRNINNIIDNLTKLEKVCLTRKTFSGIPNIKRQILELQKHCNKKNIKFSLLYSPARFYREDKQKEWSNFLLT